jgi:hypothetical protein
MTVVYESKNIAVEETPNGCYITDNVRGTTVQVGFLEDINAIIESLNRLKLGWYSEETKCDNT